MNSFENSFDFNIPDKDLPSFELISYLEKRIKEKVDEYEILLKQKDETINKLNQRILELEIFIEDLKKSKVKSEESILSHNKELLLKIEESKNLLVKQKEKHQKEIMLLKNIYDKTKADLDSISKELDDLKREKAELKNKNLELIVEKEKIENKLKIIENQLSQAKEAVEKTLSELLNERKKVDEFSKRVRDLQKENEELHKEIESIKLAWDSERAQWKEMWERERSLWESHRMEFAVWEERLRSEREAWLKILREEEHKGVENAKKLAEVLEESSKWSYKVGELLKLYANKEIVVPHIFSSVETVKKKVNEGVKRIVFITLFSISIFIALFYIYYTYSIKLHLSPFYSRILDDNNYTSFVKKGNLYLFTHPKKGIVVKDEDFKSVDLVDEVDGFKIKPSLISLEGDFVWIFDMSSLRFMKLDLERRKVISSLKSLTYAPQGMISDGTNLWSFDGIGGVLQKYELNGEIRSVKTYELNGIKVVDGMCWLDEYLILLSNSTLYRFKLDGEKFIKKSSQKTKNFVYCYIYKDDIYILKDMISNKKLEIYKIKNREKL
ncbi:MAG: hypothetical protein N2446_02325 [Elusimicrobiales bacterium]|nr:hypothetical protein [Elusimicrobiales bacterium]